MNYYVYNCFVYIIVYIPFYLNFSQQVVQERRPIRPDISRDRPELGRDDKLLSVSGKRKCSHCGEELGMLFADLVFVIYLSILILS